MKEELEKKEPAAAAQPEAAAEQPAVETTAETTTAPAAQEEPETVNPSDGELEDSLSTLLAEAEQRGYLRARNEIARAAMRKPRLWESTRRTAAEQPAAVAQAAPDDPAAEPSLTSDFLTRLRPSVWD